MYFVIKRNRVCIEVSYNKQNSLFVISRPFLLYTFKHTHTRHSSHYEKAREHAFTFFKYKTQSKKDKYLESLLLVLL